MSEVIQQVDWFMPPVGTLEGSYFDIALRFVDRRRADEIHIMKNPLYGHCENAVRNNNRLEKVAEELAHQERRLLSGDEELAVQLTETVQQEVIELNSGLRGNVTGEAHLYFARRKAIQYLLNVAQTKN